MATLDELNAPRVFVDLCDPPPDDEAACDDFFAVEHRTHLPSAPQRPCAAALPEHLWQTPDHSHLPPLLPFEELLALHAQGGALNDAAAGASPSHADDDSCDASAWEGRSGDGAGEERELRSPPARTSPSDDLSDAENTIELLRTPKSERPPSLAAPTRPRPGASPGLAAGTGEQVAGPLDLAPPRRDLPPPRRVTAAPTAAPPAVPAALEEQPSPPPAARRADASVTMRTPVRAASARESRNGRTDQMNDADFEELIRRNNKRLQAERIATVRARANARSRTRPPASGGAAHAPSAALSDEGGGAGDPAPTASAPPPAATKAATETAPLALSALLSGHNERTAAHRRQQQQGRLEQQRHQALRVVRHEARRGLDDRPVDPADAAGDSGGQPRRRDPAAVDATETDAGRRDSAAPSENVPPPATDPNVRSAPGPGAPAAPPKVRDAAQRRSRDAGQRHQRRTDQHKPRVAAHVQFTSAVEQAGRPRGRLEASVDERRARSQLQSAAGRRGGPGDGEEQPPGGGEALLPPRTHTGDGPAGVAGGAAGGRPRPPASRQQHAPGAGGSAEGAAGEGRPAPMTKTARDRAAKEAEALDRQELDLAALLTRHNSSIQSQRRGTAAARPQR
jgi:hypothetical protein